MTPQQLAAASQPWVGNGLQQAGNNGAPAAQPGLAPGRQGWTTVAGGLMGHFIPGAGAFMGIGNAFNGAEAANDQTQTLAALSGIAPTAGSLIGAGINGAVGHNVFGPNSGIAATSNTTPTPGVGRYLGMENALDPGVMGLRPMDAFASQAAQGVLNDSPGLVNSNPAAYRMDVQNRLSQVGLSPSVFGSSGNAGGGNGGGSYGGYGGGSSHPDEGTGPGGLRGGGT